MKFLSSVLYLWQKSHCAALNLQNHWIFWSARLVQRHRIKYLKYGVGDGRGMEGTGERFFSSHWAEMIYFGVEKEIIQIIPSLCIGKARATAFTRGWDAARLLQSGPTTTVVLPSRAECATILHCAVKCLWLMRMDRRRRKRKSSRRRRKMYHCRPGMQGTWEACRNCFFFVGFFCTIFLSWPLSDVFGNDSETNRNLCNSRSPLALNTPHVKITENVRDNLFSVRLDSLPPSCTNWVTIKFLCAATKNNLKKKEKKKASPCTAGETALSHG